VFCNASSREPIPQVGRIPRMAETRTTLAGSFRTTAMTATAEYARGLVLLAQGDARMASTRQRHAIELWHEIGALYETAKVRTALGEAYRAAGDEEAARLELNQRRRISNVLVPCRTRSMWASCLVMIRASLRGPASA
jgi:Flp pilus assembly protein TadD